MATQSFHQMRAGLRADRGLTARHQPVAAIQLELLHIVHDVAGHPCPNPTIDQLSSIQLVPFDLDEYRRLRAEFTSDAWLDLMIFGDPRVQGNIKPARYSPNRSR